jgi:ribose/xylose/arabinose/galactoside ABC-type transport system permease subunit
MNRVFRQKLSGFAIFAAILLEVIVFTTLAPQFLSFENLINVALSIAVIGILAVGMTFVILTSGIDLSIGSIVALAGVAAAIITRETELASLGFAAALAIGLASGAFNGAAIAHFRVPPFVVTLAVLTIARGLAFIFSEGRSIGSLPESFGQLGKSVFLGVPFSVWLMISTFALGWFLLQRTTFGRYVYAIGGNREAARLSGVKTKAVEFRVYLLNGFFVGLAAIALASRLGAGVPNSGLQYELDVIAAVVVGGTSLSGGRGSVVSTFFGAVFIAVLNNGLNLVGIDTYVQKIILGIVILLAVLADRFNRAN